MSGRAARRARALAYLRQPYIRAISRARANGAIPTVPGTHGTIAVYHDEGCPRLRGGLCSCQPELEVRWLPSRR